MSIFYKKRAMLFSLVVTLILVIGCTDGNIGIDDDNYLKVSVDIPSSSTLSIEDKLELNSIEVAIINESDEEDREEKRKDIEPGRETVEFRFSDLEVGATYRVEVITDDTQGYDVYEGSKGSDPIGEGINKLEVGIDFTEVENLIVLMDEFDSEVSSAKAVLIPTETGLEADFDMGDNPSAEFGQIGATVYGLKVVTESTGGTETIDVEGDIYALPGRIEVVNLSSGGDDGSLKIDVDFDISPDAPTNLSVDADKLDAGEVLIEWDSAQSIKGYLVYRSEGSLNDKEPLSDSLISDNWFEDESAEEGKVYYYWVQAYSESNLSSDLSSFLEVDLSGNIGIGAYLRVNQPVDEGGNLLTGALIEMREESSSQFEEIQYNMDYPVTEGNYIVRVSKDGYEIFEESIEISSGGGHYEVSPTLVEDNIIKEDYIVTVNSAVDGDGDPLTGVEVQYRSSNDSNFTTLTESSIELEEGSYAFRATKEGYNNWQETILLDQNREISPILNAENNSEYYSTNPNGQLGQNKTITALNDWTEEMKVVQGVVADTPRSWRGYHEFPDPDLYALFAAWDDTNLYLMVEMPNMDEADTIDNDASYAGSQFLPMGWALNTGVRTAGTGLMADGANVWTQGEFYTFDHSGIDTLIMHHPRFGVGEPGFFMTDDNGDFSYEEEYLMSFPDAGIEREVHFNESISEQMWAAVVPGEGMGGLGGKESTDMSTYDYIDVKAEGREASAYQITIPLASLGIDKNYLETTGIEVAVFSTFGESMMNILPWDPSMIDKAADPYSSDPSTSFEKEDYDPITVPLARIGAN